MILDPFSSPHRPVLRGSRGAVAAAHPLAASAAQRILARGGNAADACVAAQAVLCVTSPDACGLGGDMLCLARGPDARVVALNGAGATPADYPAFAISGGGSATVPGLVDGWGELAGRLGRLPLAQTLAPAIALARDGIRVGRTLAEAALAQRPRLLAGGAGAWTTGALREGGTWRQPELALALEAIAAEGARTFYEGELAGAVARAARRHGGTLTEWDLAGHRTVVAEPVSLSWRGVTVHAQPPLSQGVLVPLCLANLERLGALDRAARGHALVELTDAAFGLRDRSGEGAALLGERLDVDVGRASRRGGPRAYLHTAGVATADRDGLVVASLVSVFDDFGACVLVPEGGFTLNNRAAGFTGTPNDPAPGKRPVHTLAPIIIEGAFGAIGLATPGADGQVQTLLQVLTEIFDDGLDLAGAVAAPRWRSEEGRLLVEASHPGASALAALGHDVVPIADGHAKFGAVVAAGLSQTPLAVADWRRETWAGVA